jgi:hypothetical protein
MRKIVYDTDLDAVLRHEGVRLDADKLAQMPHPLRMRHSLNAEGSVDALVMEKLLEETGKEPGDLHDLLLWKDSKVANDLLNMVVQSGLPLEEANTVVHQTYHMVCFRIAGSKVFRISPGLAQRLQGTSLPKIPSEYLQLPYRTIYLEVPARSGLLIYNEHTGWHVLEGCYVTMTEEEGERLLRVMAVAKANENSHSLTDDALMYFRIELDRPDLPACLTHAANTLAQERARGEFQETIPPVFRFVTNALLYTTSADAVISVEYLDPSRKKLEERRRKAKGKTRKLAKIKAALEKTLSDQVRVMGENIRVIKPRPDSDAEDDGDPTWDPKSGFRVNRDVMGHWKRVHTKAGPKVKWIDSYERGQWVKYGATESYEVR